MPALLDVADVASAVRVPDRPGRPVERAGRENPATDRALEAPEGVRSCISTCATQSPWFATDSLDSDQGRAHVEIQDPTPSHTTTSHSGPVQETVRQSDVLANQRFRDAFCRDPRVWLAETGSFAALPSQRFETRSRHVVTLTTAGSTCRPGPDVQITRGLDLVTSPSLPLVTASVLRSALDRGLLDWRGAGTGSTGRASGRPPRRSAGP